jgi:hypothetical protein
MKDGLEWGLDGDGSIIVADTINHCICKIAASMAPPLCRSPTQLPSVHMSRMEALLNDLVVLRCDLCGS